MGRSKERPMKDWVSQSSNWKHLTQIRYPATPTSPVIINDPHSGDLSQTNVALRGRQVTADENHGFSVRKSLLDGKFDGDRGGRFFSTKSTVLVRNGDKQHSYGGGESFGSWISDDYRGPIFAIDPRTVAIPIGTLMQNLEPMGTHAIAQCKPTNNVANLATDLSEIATAGLPSLTGAALWKEKTNLAKGSGSEFLNSEFGWKPLVSDVRDASYAAANAHRLLAAYERNSGKIVRRRYDFPEEKTELDEVVGPSDGFSFAIQDFNLLDFSKSKPVLHKTTKSYRKTWFSGAFTYHLPIGYNSRNRLVSAAAKAGPLLGIELTPETVWNASPWTWAVDWFSNAGDVISNLSDWAVDGLVLKWGYIMEHTYQEVTYSLDRPCRFKPFGTCFASPVTAYIETKRREKATPFGFEVTWNGLSPRQLAISAALGITRVF